MLIGEVLEKVCPDEVRYFVGENKKPVNRTNLSRNIFVYDYYVYVVDEVGVCLNIYL